jgi:hypothetical protein
MSKRDKPNTYVIICYHQMLHKIVMISSIQKINVILGSAESVSMVIPVLPTHFPLNLFFKIRKLKKTSLSNGEYEKLRQGRGGERGRGEGGAGA